MLAINIQTHAEASRLVQTNHSENSLLFSVAARLAELGHPTRLLIFKLLVKSGRNGLAVGDIQQKLDIPSSTLSHHIAKMIKVGLIKQIRESRTLFCFPVFESLAEVIIFLQEECCANECNN